MANEYYERLSEMNPGDLADGLAMEAEFDAVAQGFSKLPTPHTGGQGFDGPVRVGDAVNTDEAVSLGQLNAAIGEAVLLPIATYGNLAAAAWETLPSNTYLLFGTGAQLSNTPYALVAGSTYYLQVRHVIGGAGVAIYHDALSLASTDDASNVDLRRLFVRTGSTFAAANAGGWSGFALKKAALTALESLTPAADRIAYYTSGAAAAMATITATARSLLDDATVADMRDTLGLGMTVSLGTFSDFNDPALFSASTSLTAVRVAASGLQPANRPSTAANWWYTWIYPRSTGGGSVYFRQTAVSSVTGDTYERVNLSNDNGATIVTYGTWRRVYSQENILGSVSKTGGVPTGAIIERGSNANGEYVIFADGTAIAWHSVTSTLTSGAGDGLNVAVVAWTYPITINTLAYNATHMAPARVLINGGRPTASPTQASFYAASINPFSGLSVTSLMVVVGRAF
ncbi:TPA: hypothetical protein P2I01_003626 [Aeromonas salmonicida]|nr:hypothetical protein [Aeromonas salmonicida]